MNAATALADRLTEFAPAIRPNAIGCEGPCGTSVRVELTSEGYLCRFDLSALSGQHGRSSDLWVAWSVDLRAAVAEAWPEIAHLPLDEVSATPEPSEPPARAEPEIEHAYPLGPSISEDLVDAYWRAHRDGLLALVQDWAGPALSWRVWARPAAVALGVGRGWDALPETLPARRARKVARVLARAVETLDLPRGIEALDLRGLPDNLAIELASGLRAAFVVTNAYVALTVARTA